MLTLIALVANVIGSLMALPQFRRLVVTRDVAGISPAWVVVSAAMNAWWFSYALAGGIWELVPVSVISASLYCSIAVVIVGVSGRRAVPGLLGGLLVGAAPLAVLATAGWTATGVAIGLGYGVQLLPALVAAWRTTELSGIAAGTWWIALGEAALWLAFGVGVRDVPLVVAGAAGVLVSGAILLRLQTTGHRPLDAFAVGKRRRVTIVNAET